MHKVCHFFNKVDVDEQIHQQKYPHNKNPKNVENRSYTRSYPHYPQKFSTFIMLITWLKTNGRFGKN